MITLEKLKEYEEYHGFYDGFYLQKVRNGINKTTDAEWSMIGILIQDLRLKMKGLVSIDFTENLDALINTNCENEDTIRQLKYLAEQEW